MRRTFAPMLAALALIAGCAVPPAYKRCAEPGGSCVGARSRCLRSGQCAVPAVCPSGYAYSRSAEYAGSCVPAYELVDGATSTDASPDARVTEDATPSDAVTIEDVSSDQGSDAVVLADVVAADTVVADAVVEGGSDAIDAMVEQDSSDTTDSVRR